MGEVLIVRVRRTGRRLVPPVGVRARAMGFPRARQADRPITSQRWHAHQRLQPGRPPVWLATPPRPYPPPPPIDWKSWCRTAERKRRAWDRARPVATNAPANEIGSEEGTHGNGDGSANGDADGRATAVA